MARGFLPVVLVLVLVLVVSLLAVSHARAGQNEIARGVSLHEGAAFGCNASGVTTSAPGALLALAALAGTILFLARWGRCQRPQVVDRRHPRRRRR